MIRIASPDRAPGTGRRSPVGTGLAFVVLALALCQAQTACATAVCVAQDFNLYRMEDLNGDGDALDTGEWVLWMHGESSVGQLAACGADIFYVDFSLPPMGGVIRVVDVNGDGDALDAGERSLWGIPTVGFESLCASPDGDVFGYASVPSTIYRMHDVNGDGDALDAGEQTVFASGLSYVGRLAWHDGSIYFGETNQLSIRRLTDLNGDGDALDVGEVAAYSPMNLDTPGDIAWKGTELYVACEGTDRIYQMIDRNGDNDVLDVGEVLDYVDPMGTQLQSPVAVTAYGDDLLVAESMEISLVCDRNGDGDALDIGEIVSFASTEFTASDLVLFGEEELPPARIPGDANGDGKVDGSDLALWQQNYDPLGLSPNTWEMGDWNDDGRVDGTDLALWQQYYDPLGHGVTGGMQSIPEPGTLMLLCGGALVALMRRRGIR